MTISDVKLYAIYVLSVCSLTVNVALNKPAYQQYSYRPRIGKYDASKAVDGRKSDLSWDGGQCAVSDLNKRTATWWVNLTSIYSIHHINIFYIKGNAPWKHHCLSIVKVIVYLANDRQWYRLWITYLRFIFLCLHLCFISLLVIIMVPCFNILFVGNIIYPHILCQCF